MHEFAFWSIARTRVATSGIRPGGLRLIRRALAFLNLGPHCRSLDVGCGTGVTVEYLVHDRGLNAVGLDASREMIADGKVRRSSLPLLAGDSRGLPFPADTFDFLSMECVLSLVAYVPTVLAECRRVLKTGGAIMVSDVYAREPCGLPGLRSLTVPSCLRGAFDERALLEECARAGFRTLLWQDHSSLLREFAAKVIWECGSLAPFFGVDQQCDGVYKACVGAVKKARPGYFLYIGQAVSGGDL